LRVGKKPDVMESQQKRNWATSTIRSIIRLEIVVETVEWRPDPVLSFLKELDSFKQVLYLICGTSVDFSNVSVFVEYCDNVCVEFNRNLTSQSRRDLASFKNWPSVRSKGLGIGDIIQFLAGVRSVLQFSHDISHLAITDNDYHPRVEGTKKNMQYLVDQIKLMKKNDASTASPAIPETRGLPMRQFPFDDIAGNPSMSADQLAVLRAWLSTILGFGKDARTSTSEGTVLSKPASSKDGQHTRGKPLQTSSVDQPAVSDDSDQGTVKTYAGHVSDTTIGTSRTRGEGGARRTLGVTNQPGNDAEQIKVTCLVKDNSWIWTGPPSQFMQQFECLQKHVYSQQGLLSRLELRLLCDKPFYSQQPNNSIEFLFPSPLMKVTFDVVVAFTLRRNNV
ncbi:hypothetical protein CI238_11999, partial [Colletotrichum incanum]